MEYASLPERYNDHTAYFLLLFLPACVSSCMVTITEFSDRNKNAFKRLNEEWLNKYFAVEPIDAALLSEPKKEILDAGGKIFYAMIGDEVVGTVALIKSDDKVFELGKMAVTEKHQGMGIGKKLLGHALGFAKENGTEKVILYSHTSLKSAIHLYKKFGFTEVPLDTGHYRRSDIKMEKVL